MQPILTIGIIIFTGFIAGEFCTRIKLPKVTGYILAGLLLNPDLTHFIPNSFVSHTSLVTNIALSFITFSVGGTLLFPKVRSLGKPILWITLFEAEFAFLFVAVAFIFLGPALVHQSGASSVTFFVPLAFLLAALASPTDPSATLAVEHEYHAKGKVTSTIMGVAAFDDLFGIVNYSLAISAASILVAHQPFGAGSIATPLFKILGSIFSGAFFGFALNGLSNMIKRETEGVLITLIFSLLGLCYGLANLTGADELLATMSMGIFVVNFNEKREKIFKILERYTEELIFVLFFTISAMHLNFSVLSANYPLILIFVIFRAIGKLTGTLTGGMIAKADSTVQKYTAGGLIPQGGIVIGLALMIKQYAAFSAISDIILNVTIGATIIHEIIGPVVSKFSLQKAGEIKIPSPK